MLLYFLTAFARDTVGLVEHKEGFTWFNTPGMTQLRLIQSLIFCTCAFAAYLVPINYYARLGLLRTLLIFLACLLVIITLRYLTDQVICPWLFGFRNYPRHVNLAFYYLDSFGFCLYYAVWGLAFFFFDFVRQKEAEKKDILLESRLAELSFLRAQLNPHFLFNSLNNIYALVATRPKEALPVLDQLSSLMRYMLYENEAQVPLKTELKYLYDYIALQNIRYPAEEQVRLELALENMELEITPLLLLPLVENVFKHGRPPARVFLGTISKTLSLNTLNGINREDERLMPGIGLANMRRRLELLYPARYSLTAGQKDGNYFSELQLELP